MDVVKNIFDFIVNDLGSTIVLPVIMMMIGIVVGMKIKHAFSAGLMLGVAFSGVSLVISYMTGTIEPAGTAMMESLGRTFKVVDGGWTALASISWSWPYAFLLFPFQIVINFIMLALGKTKTLNVDMWNVWGKVFMAVCVSAISGSVLLGFLAAGVRIILELIIGDAYQPRLKELTGLPGVSCPHSLFLFTSILYPVDWVLRKIPFLNKWNINAQFLKDKFGIFAENHVLGFILGLLFGILARFSIVESITLGVAAGAALTLLPMVTKLFMQALAPISDAATEFMKKRYSDREIYIGLDGPICLGNPEVWVTCILTIPFTLLWAIILPNNEILPFAGIMNLTLALCAHYITKGNIVRSTILMALVGTPVYLLTATAMAPLISDLAVKNGFIEQGQMISNAAMDAPMFSYAFSHIFNVGKYGILPILCAVYFIIGFVWNVHDLKKEQRAESQQ